MLKFNIEGDDKIQIAQVLIAAGQALLGDAITVLPAIETKVEPKAIAQKSDKAKRESYSKTEAPAPNQEPEPAEETGHPQPHTEEEPAAAPAGVTFETVQKMFAELKVILDKKLPNAGEATAKLKALREEAVPGSKALTDMRKDEFKQFIPDAFLLLQKGLKANGDA